MITITDLKVFSKNRSDTWLIDYLIQLEKRIEELEAKNK
jgi:hypothetical protein